RHHSPEILAGGQPGGTEPAAQGAHQRWPQDVEAVAHGPRVVPAMARLFPCPRRDVQGKRYDVGAVVRGTVRRQEACEIERDPSLAGSHSLRKDRQEDGETPRQAASRGLQGAGLPLQVCPRTRLDGWQLVTLNHLRRTGGIYGLSRMDWPR